MYQVPITLKWNNQVTWIHVKGKARHCVDMDVDFANLANSCDQAREALPLLSSLTPDG